MSLCPICGGDKKKGLTTFTVELRSTLLVVRGVPADICTQCGEEWISSDVSKKLEKITNDVRKKKPDLEIISFEEAA
jgi:YgiT-type zinc finger domain-containing protein